MTTRISVVLPTCRRPELLDRCLGALVLQDCGPDAYEVIVVDDGDCPDTRRVVAWWAEHVERNGGGPCVRYLPGPGRRGPAAARNAGWRASRGEIIAFTDDDCIPVPGWLRAGAGAFVDGVVGATGRLIVPLPPIPTDYERNAAALEGARFATANCFYHRDALEASGGFDERFTAPWREDSDLFFTLLEQRSRLVDVPEAVVIHPVRPARWGISLFQQRKSMFNALLYKKHPELYREILRPVTPWHYYLIAAALLVAAVAALAGWAGLARASALAWLVMTGAFALYRLRGTSLAPQHVLEMAVTSTLIPPLATFWRVRGSLKFRVLFL